MSIIIFDSRFAEIGADGGVATAKVAGFTQNGQNARSARI
jgi:hypothetical protein